MTTPHAETAAPVKAAAANQKDRVESDLDATSRYPTQVDKIAFLKRMAADKRVSDSMFRVWMTLLFKFHNSRSGCCFPSLRAIAEACGKHKSTVIDALKRGRELRYGDFNSNSGGRSQSNRYWFTPERVVEDNPFRTPLNDHSLKRVAPDDPKGRAGDQKGSFSPSERVAQHDTHITEKRTEKITNNRTVVGGFAARPSFIVEVDGIAVEVDEFGNPYMDEDELVTEEPDERLKRVRTESTLVEGD
jgi:hypothetical protein